MWDLYPDGKFPGGAPANFAYHVHHLGQAAYIISRVGRDSLGEELLERLAMAGLETRLIQRDVTRPTGTVKVKLDRQGNPRFECAEDVAFDHIEPAPQWPAFYETVDAVLFGTLAQRRETSRNAIREFLNHCTKALRVYDINIRGWDEITRHLVLDSLRLADVLKLNEEEHRLLRETLGDLPGVGDVRGVGDVQLRRVSAWCLPAFSGAGVRAAAGCPHLGARGLRAGEQRRGGLRARI